MSNVFDFIPQDKWLVTLQSCLWCNLHSNAFFSCARTNLEKYPEYLFFKQDHKEAAQVLLHYYDTPEGIIIEVEPKKYYRVIHLGQFKNSVSVIIELKLQNIARDDEYYEWLGYRKIG